MCAGGTCMGCRTALGQTDSIYQLALSCGYSVAEAIMFVSMSAKRYKCCSQQLQTSIDNGIYELAYTPAAKRDAVNRLRQSYADAGTPAPQSLDESMQDK